MQPQVRRLTTGLDLWLLVDCSASAADAMAARLPEWETLLERSKGPDDRLFHVDYADVPEWMRGAVQVGPYALPFGPVASGVDPEWNFDRARVAELQNASRA